MTFNSWNFFLFFAFIFLVYWRLPAKIRNFFLLLGSVIFYACWDFRFLTLLFGTCVFGFYCGKNIHQAESNHKKNRWLLLAILYNLGTLAIFKYYGFFVENFIDILSLVGINATSFRLEILLPVGISFFNFHALSYVIDLYRGEIKPTQKFVDFALFIAFFPLLVAGPIERASHLLPQIQSNRNLSWEAANKGVWLFFWGLWKKVFVADNLSIFVDRGFDHSASIDFITLYLTAIAFAFQIYCDFSGYTDMARGCAKLLGFELLKNFNLPYFAANPVEFWKRWHISLSSWLRDYLYIPLGGNRHGKWKTRRNLFLTMTIGGLWHGAAWNFLLWGIYQGLLLIAFNILSKQYVIRMSRWLAIGIMLQFTLIGWIIFRCNRMEVVDGIQIDRSLNQILELCGTINRGFSWNQDLVHLLCTILAFTLPLIAIQIGQNLQKNMYFISSLPAPWRAAIQGILLFLLVRYGVQSGGSFIYFQF